MPSFFSSYASSLVIHTLLKITEDLETLLLTTILGKNYRILIIFIVILLIGFIVTCIACFDLSIFYTYHYLCLGWLILSNQLLFHAAYWLFEHEKFYSSINFEGTVQNYGSNTSNEMVKLLLCYHQHYWLTYKESVIGKKKKYLSL